MRNHKSTKLLSLLMAVVMLLGMIPVAAAEEYEPESIEEVTEEVSASPEKEANDDIETEDSSNPEDSAPEKSEETTVISAEEEISIDDPVALEETEKTDEELKEENETLCIVKFVSDVEFSLKITDENGSELELPEIIVSEEVPIYSYYVELLQGQYFYSAISTAEGNKEISDVAFLVDNDSSEKTIEVVFSEALPYGFKGMPEEYTLSESQIKDKEALLEHGVYETLLTLAEGVDYEKGTLVFLADSEEYAKIVADAYNADLEYSYGVAVITLREASVIEAIEVASDIDNNMPALDPNYIYEMNPEIYGTESQDVSDLDGAQSVPVSENWESIIESLGQDADPFIKNPEANNTYQWMHDAVNSYAAWGVTTGTGVEVAVIDTGVYSTNDDLYGKVTYETVTGSTAPTSEHGTHVAGIIAATLNNGFGGAGIAPGASILSIEGSTVNGSEAEIFETEDMLEAINKAASSGAKIINMSLGGEFYTYSEYVALNNAVKCGKTIVAAMSNDGSNIKSYPAAYNIPGLISVCATDRNGALASFSNSGAWADVSAPGVDIMSTISDNYFQMMNGTSMATPVVSGICALYLSVYPDATPAQVEAAVKNAVNKVGSASAGTGIVDASKLFTGDRQAPQISVEGYKSGAKVPYTSKIEISATGNVQTAENPLFEKDEAVIIYTVNGKSPAVLNGEITSGEIYPDGGIEVYDLGKVGTAVTVKAAVVSGMGIMGNVATYKLTVSNPEAESISISAPSYMISGKSVELTAKVYPDEASQSVKWTVVKGENCKSAAISGNKLTASLSNTSQSGAVTVIATSGTETCEKVIEIKTPASAMVNTVLLSEKTVTLTVSGDSKTSKTVTAVFKNKAGEELSPSYKWTSSNVKVATVDENGIITAVGKGSASVTCTALDGSGKKASVKVNALQLVENIDISGQDSIAPGGKATYKVSAYYPTTANSKKVSWSCDADASVASINSSGALTVKSGTPNGTEITITATAIDGGGCSKSISVFVYPKTSAVKLSTASECPSTEAYTDVTSKTVTIYTVDRRLTGNEYITYDESVLEVQAETVGNIYTAPKWSSSNEKVATISGSGDSVKIEAKSKGKTVITAAAQDGSGKKATFTVNVVVPCSSVSINPKGRNYLYSYSDTCPISIGKSVTSVASYGNAYGTPSAPGVKWSIEEGGSYATINAKTGALSVSKNAPAYVDIIVKAEATDYSGNCAYFTYFTYPTVTKIGMAVYVSDKNTNRQIKTIGMYTESSCDGFYLVDYTKSSTYKNWYSSKQYSIETRLYSNNTDVAEICSVKSSDPDICGAYVYSTQKTDGSYEYWLHFASGMKKGTATITFKTEDGSNKSCSVKVVVS